MNHSDSLIGILYEMSRSPFPAEVEKAARICILDELGAVYGGAKQLAPEIERYFELQPRTEDGASVLGCGRTASMEQAALWGGMCGHIFDIDDGNRFCNYHPGSGVIPAVLAVCDFCGRSMNDLIRGVVIGYEAAVRVALCAQPSHRMRGHHTSGTCGAVGAALGCAAALGFGPEQMKSALAAAAAAASGLLEMQENVSGLKPYNLGHAAMAGVTAVSLAYAGFVGPEDPLCGKRGLLSVLTDGYKTEPLDMLPDGHYAVCDTYHKTYAACRHCHSALDSTLAIAEKPGVTPENIRAVTLHIYAQGAMGHDHKTCPSIVSAKMSVPYAIALALATGAAGIPSYTEERLSDPTILSLLEKITVVTENELSAEVPQKRPAVVDVELLDGTKYSVRTDIPRGEPELPLTMAAFIRKFDDLLVYGGKTPEQAQEIRETILSGDGAVRDLARSLR